MTRFNRLEFEPPSNPAERPAPSRNITPDPDHDQRHWLKLATEERKMGHYENALRMYSRALEWDRSVVAGWIGQVQMLIALDEYPEAEVWARKALELFKNNAELLACHAQALCRKGDFKRALASSDAALNQPGISSYPWIVRAELMLAQTEDSARHCFDKAVLLDGGWLQWLEIGDIYMHYNNPATALGRIRRAVELAPDQPYVWYAQGRCETLLGLTCPAEISYRQCLQLSANHVEARRALEKLARQNPVRNFFRAWFGST